VALDHIDSIVEGFSSHVSCASARRVSTGGSHRLRRRCDPQLPSPLRTKQCLALGTACAVRVASDRRPAVSALLIASGHQPEGDEQAGHEMDRDKEYVYLS